MFKIAKVNLPKYESRFKAPFWKGPLPDNPRYPDYVYVIVDTRTGYSKIGISYHPEIRLKALRTDWKSRPEPDNKGRLPEGVFILAGYIPAHRDLERYLHHVFLEKHVRGEWFKLTTDDIRTILGPNLVNIQAIMAIDTMDAFDPII